MPHHQCISNCKGYKFRHHIQEFLHKLSDCISESSAIALRRESAVGRRLERQLQGSARCGTRSRAAKRGETLSRYPRGRLLRFPSEGHFDPFWGSPKVILTFFWGTLRRSFFFSVFQKVLRFLLRPFLTFHPEVPGKNSVCGCSWVFILRCLGRVLFVGVLGFSFRGDWDELCLWMFLVFHSEETGMSSVCGCS